MPIDIDALLAADPIEWDSSWTQKDVILYHLGIGAGVSDEELKILKTIEIQHCRLAMIASFGFIVEALAWGAGPLDVFG